MKFLFTIHPCRVEEDGRVSGVGRSRVGGQRFEPEVRAVEVPLLIRLALR